MISSFNSWFSEYFVLYSDLVLECLLKLMCVCVFVTYISFFKLILPDDLWVSIFNVSHNRHIWKNMIIEKSLESLFLLAL